MPAARCSLFFLAWLAGATACGDKVEAGLTGMDIHVSFDGALPVYKLRFSGWMGSTVAFAQDDRPDEDRTPSPDGEKLIVLLTASVSGSVLFIQVDGIDRGGATLGSSGKAVPIEAGRIAVVEIQLGPPRLCGDGERHPDAELCDDGNGRSGDGCSSQCVVEDEWQCEGMPSVCRRCGDQVCSQGEDLCTCPQDCTGATCGDALCCEAAGESCSCAQDCGEPVCGDDICCDGEDDCRADCGSCGNGDCELDKGEDACRCPEDCDPGEGTCGNGSCCAADDEDPASCAQDCCQDPQCGDGTCCPLEDARSCPDDCCATPQCNDGVCCPGETAAGCPADCCETNPVCSDGVCCGGETAESCPEDCCGQDPPCGDGHCCPGETCDPDGCGGCPLCTPDVCDPCCAGCSEQFCSFTCDTGCDCTYDCAGANACNVDCINASCFVECPGGNPCNISCKQSLVDLDAGTVLSGDCACRGSGCHLNCAVGDAIRCPDDVTIACSLLACP